MRAALTLFFTVGLLSSALAACVLPSQALSHGPTTLISGLPGFTVLDNVWYRNRTFYVLEGGSEIPQTDRLLSLSQSNSGTQGVERVNWREMAFYDGEDNSPKGIQAKPDVEIEELHGITLFFNDGWDGKWSGYKWLYHMVAEALLGSLSVLSSVPPLPTCIQSRRQDQNQAMRQGRVTYGGDGKLPDRLVIAWDYNWDARYGLPRAVVEALFGDDNLIEPEGWTQMTSQDTWIYFERVLLVDRDTAHRHNPLAHQWLKMAVDAYRLASSPSFFFPTRHALLSHYDIPTYTRSAPGLRLSGRKPKIVYVDRQRTERKFDMEVHKQLLNKLKKIEKAEKAVVVNAVLEDLEKEEQFRMFSDADIILGIHGNGLSHELWMPEGGIIIEILPPTSFHYDYPPVSAALGHEHIIWQYDKLFPRDKWIPENTKRNASLIHDGSLIPLDVDSFTKLAEALVDSMSFSYH
ncbi:uncharacterized protein IAS62_001520 [Cryptococcus decagattii]|uniref:Glycosyltransferase 61 catalytic domain-containing protein n=1 Tax=Cryptococcus decagattii TaxID=1859122 RepID=A0ABZ2AP27_9TREE